MKHLLIIISLMLLLFSCKKDSDTSTSSNSNPVLDFKIDTNYIKSGNSLDFKRYYLFHKSEYKDTVYKQTITDTYYNLKVKYYSSKDPYNNRTIFNVSGSNDKYSEVLPIISFTAKIYYYTNTIDIILNANYYDYYTNSIQELDMYSDSYFKTINNKYLIIIIKKRYYYFKI